jgi:hypothetical protein
VLIAMRNKPGSPVRIVIQKWSMFAGVMLVSAA